VLAAVAGLLHDPAFHDVAFVCGDGGVVTANRAFLAARNPYFAALLYGPHREGVGAAAAAAVAAAGPAGSAGASLATVSLPAASARALRRVLGFLHTGELPPEGRGSRGGGGGPEAPAEADAGAAAPETAAAAAADANADAADDEAWRDGRAAAGPPARDAADTADAAPRDAPPTWRVLLETCGLAQQLLLPEVVLPLARRVAAGLPPEDAGPALSAALEAGLQPVVGHLWRALPALIPRGAGAWRPAAAAPAAAAPGGAGQRRIGPLAAAGLAPRFSGDSGFSAAAIAFLLESVPASVVAGPDPPPPPPPPPPQVWPAFPPMTATAAAEDAKGPPAAAAATVTGAAGEGGAGPSGQGDDGPEGGGGGGGGGGSLLAGTSAGFGGGAPGEGPTHRGEEEGAAAAPGGTATAGDGSGGGGGLSRQQPAPEHPSAAICGAGGGGGARLPPAMVTSTAAPPAALASEDEGSPRRLLHDLCAGAITAEERLLRGVLDWVLEQHEQQDDEEQEEQQQQQPEQEDGGGGTTAPAVPDAPAPPARPAAALRPAHQQALESLLLRLDWSAVAPRWLERVLRAGADGGGAPALLSPSRAAGVSRAALLCMHQSAAGRLSLSQTPPRPRFDIGPAFALPRPFFPADEDPIFSDGASASSHLRQPQLPLVRRLQRWGGAEVLECEAVPHVTVQSRLPLPLTGRHCFTVSVEAACDLVWVGLSDGAVEPAGWGGKHHGAWLAGSNDALCHYAQSDRSAYATLCGLGRWGEGAVVGVFLDCDAGECFFALLSGGAGQGGKTRGGAGGSGGGRELRPGFQGLPTGELCPLSERRALHVAVSIRAPAQLAFRFRPWSWVQPRQH